ncbi:unnamed protein product [Phytophthora fragariaefolia]|uniref:Unnamed protein product n=1 Tax=Phytophthora fragariaefolia TaxID=1490495 RepID=A0A9W6XPQ4_9STRA|nr:unnamed protein product [Phytophthora fragariaefolia]
MMSAPTTGPLLPHGFLSVGVVLPDTVIPELLSEAKKRDYRGVFNQVGGEDDKFREQSRVNPIRMSSALLELAKALKVVIAIHPGWVPGVLSLMVASAFTAAEPGPCYGSWILNSKRIKASLITIYPPVLANVFWYQISSSIRFNDRY